ncbi:MAG: transposase [Spirochaetia bacterium]|nr:transposase [Spirochaetia bacterium]
MAGVSLQKSGSYTYVRRTVSRRIGKKVNTEGTIIGKVDLVSKRICIKEGYDQDTDVLRFLSTMHEKGFSASFAGQESSGYTQDDVASATVLKIGSMSVMKAAAELSGLEEAVRHAFIGMQADHILSLASFLAVTGDPLMYCKSYLSGQEISFTHAEGLDSRRISSLLKTLDIAQCDAFFQQWASHVAEQEFLALDITSVSTWSTLMGMAGWGYNRDGEHLAQTNLCLICGVNSKLPVMIEPYEGELKDVSTLENMLLLLPDHLRRRCTVVTDKGFASIANINAMMGRLGTGFLTALPFTMKFTDQMIERAKQDGIMGRTNTYKVKGDAVSMMTYEQIVWPYAEEKLNTFVYRNPKVAADAETELAVKLTELQGRIDEDPMTARTDPEVRKYFTSRKKYGGKEGEYVFTLNQKKVHQAVGHAGWLVCVSNTIQTAMKAIEIYRDKDVVEEGHKVFKRQLGFRRFRVHSDDAARGLVVIAFIALVLRMWLNRKMNEADLYTSYTMREMFEILDTQMIHHIKGDRIVSPPTKPQKDIYKALGIPVPS